MLDANVLVSAILPPQSASTQIIRLVLDDALNLAVSHDILDEAYRVVRYPKLVKQIKKHDTAPEDVDSIIKRFSTISSVTPGELTLDVTQDDPSDNKILVCAIESEADYIISGDHHLTNLREFQRITIVNPATFLSVFRREKSE
ncbi:MAG: putative toxin-antitoxin system toxin component, PIN family [Candidatus Latescibacterota bacterium]